MMTTKSISLSGFHLYAYMEWDGRVIVDDGHGPGTVCSEEWDGIDATVMCQNHGYDFGTALTLPRDTNLSRKAYSVDCLGHETALTDCSYNTTDASGICDWMDDAAVECHFSHSNYTMPGNGTGKSKFYERGDYIDSEQNCVTFSIR